MGGCTCVNAKVSSCSWSERSSGSESNRSCRESGFVLLIGVGKVFANCPVIGRDEEEPEG